MEIKRIVLVILVGMLISSCGVVKRGTIPWEDNTTVEGSEALIPINMSRSDRVIRDKLDDAYTQWKGTNYLLGGTTAKGIDCSAFIQIIFKEYFRISLPRTTREQMQMGNSVRKRNIKVGDVVFFKTGKNTYHVGVMINGIQFLHAGVSEGVTISTLENQYWTNTYLTTRRMF